MLTEYENVSLTGRAKARLRRHPSTNTCFSMVTVIRPVERKMIKTWSDELFFLYRISAKSHFNQPHIENKQSEDWITFRSSELQQTVSQMCKFFCVCFSECWAFFLLYSYRIWCHLISILRWWENSIFMKSSTPTFQSEEIWCVVAVTLIILVNNRW